MVDIDVCFYNNEMYNLDGMLLLGELPSKDEMTFCQYFETLKGQYNINVAIIGFDHQLRNAIYCIFPRSFIVIRPADVMHMFESYLASTIGVEDGQEEIAASLERDCEELYAYNSKGEAIKYYRKWQAEVPLGIQCFHDIITTIDYYYEEIFNFFDFKNNFNKGI